MQTNQPFEVTIRLATPMIVPRTPLHLDGLLAWARVQEARDAGEDEPVDFQHDLPLERAQVGDQWCFKASWIEPVWCTPRRPLNYNRRLDIESLTQAGRVGLFGDKIPAFDPGRGRTKAYSLIEYEAQASHAVAQGVGDIARVEQLLRRVRCLGKLARRGKGMVTGVEIKPIDEARWTRRHLPIAVAQEIQRAAALQGDFAQAQVRTRAPYFERDAELALVPVD